MSITINQLAKEIMAEIRATEDARTSVQNVHARHPEVTDDMMREACEKAAREFEEDGRAAIEESENLGKLADFIDSLPGEPNEAIIDRVRRAAASGNPDAIALLATMEDVDGAVFWQLALAAAEAHPDWKVVEDTGVAGRRGIARTDGVEIDQLKDPSLALVDWYQHTYPAEAKAIEDRVRGTTG